MWEHFKNFKNYTSEATCPRTYNIYVKYSNWDEEHDKNQLGIQKIYVINLMMFLGLIYVCGLDYKQLNVQMGH
jgi:hypothetical protein